MAFPVGWPPQIPSGIYSLRFAVSSTATGNFSDNAFLFTHPDGSGNVAFSYGIRIVATTGNIEFSFDGANTHGTVPAGSDHFYFDRHEGGISIKGSGVFKVEAW